MLSRRGAKRQYWPVGGARQSGDVWQSAPRRASSNASFGYHFTLPPDIWVTSGVPFSLFYANTLRSGLNASAFTFVIACDIGSTSSTAWTVTPIDAQAGDHTLTLTAYDAGGKFIGTAQTTVHVIAQQAPSQPQMNVLLVGDSVTAFNLWPPILAQLMNTAGNPAWQMLGTYDGGPAVGGGEVRYEAVAGTKWSEWATSTGLPFVTPSPPTLNIPHYIATVCGGVAPTHLLFELIINDTLPAGGYQQPATFSPSDTYTDELYWSPSGSGVGVNTYAEILIAAWQAAVPGIEIGIACMTPGNINQAAYTANYGAMPTALGWEQVQRRCVTQEMIEFGGRQASKVWLVPTHLNMDIVNDFPANNAVHPLAGIGMQRIADSVYGWLKARMAVR